MTDRSGVFLNSALGATLGSGGGSLSFTTITTGQTAASNNGYACNFSTSQVLTLPTSPTVGDIIQVDSIGAGITQVQCGNASHSMYNWTTTITATGLLLLSRYETATLRYIATNKWIVEANVGTLTTGSNLVDPFFNDVTCLIPGNNNVTDYSGNALSFSTANLTFSTAQAKFTASSMLFNGTSSVVSIAANTAFKFLGSCTLEGWFYQSNRTNQQTLFDTRANGTSTTGLMLYTTSTNGYLTLWLNNGALISTSTPMPSGQWNHIAVTNNALAGTNGAWSIWLNGAFVLSGSSALALTDGLMYLGSTVAASNWYAGYAAHIRITNGVCRYSANFTVPQTTFSQVTDTTADPVWGDVTWRPIASGSNAVADSSGNAYATTVTGVTTTNVDTIQDTYAMVFDGIGTSNNSFVRATSSGISGGVFTGDFDIECFFKTTSVAGYNTIFSCGVANNATQFCVGLNGTAPVISTSSGNILTGSFTVAINTWYHLKYSRSGSVGTIFINGVSVGSVAGINQAYLDGYLILGKHSYSGYTQGWNGKIAGFRVTKFARATANYAYNAAPYLTPFPLALPTAYDPFWQDVTFMPRAAAGNTGTDVSGNALALVLTSVTTGNTTPTNQQDSYWWGFNGSTSVLSATTAGGVAANDAGKLPGDFTIECWINTSTFQSGCIWGTGVSSASQYILILTSASSTTLALQYPSTNRNITVPTMSTGTWYHLAVCRQGSTISTYFAGMLVDSLTLTTNFSDGGLFLGGVIGGNPVYSGKIAGFRVTKAARYTANFTAPTSPFLTVGAT